MTVFKIPKVEHQEIVLGEFKKLQQGALKVHLTLDYPKEWSN